MGEIRKQRGSKSREEMNISPDTSFHTVTSKVIEKLSPVTYEVIRHRLWQITNEMCTTCVRVSGSPVVSLAHDFNTGMADEIGDLVSMGPYVQFHSTTLNNSIKEVIERRSWDTGIHDGDMFMVNDPWWTGTHQSDMSVISPIFYKDKIFGWTAVVLHQADLGGVNSGSFCINARDSFDEPIPMTGVRIMINGEMVKDVEEWHLRHSRMPALAALDLRSQISANSVGKARVLKLIEEYGADTVKATFKKILIDSEAAFRKRLSTLSDGTWYGSKYAERAKPGDNKVFKVCCSLSKQGDELTFDTTGTDPNPPGVLGMPFRNMMGSAMCYVLPFLCYDIPWAPGGILKAINFVSEVGSICDLDVGSPVSCCGVSRFLTWAVVDECMGKMLSTHPDFRKEVVCATWPDWAHIMTSGLDQHQKPFIHFFLDPMAGCIGARSFKDGVDTGGSFVCMMSRTADVEAYESLYPILYLYRREEKDGGGAGKYRGGTGITLCFVLHDTQMLNIETLSTRPGHPASTGLSGGYPGNSPEQTIIRDSNVYDMFERGQMPSDIKEISGKVEIMQSPGSYVMHKNDVHESKAAGAAGYGDPLQRDPESVSRDVMNDYVSLEVARNVYGVILKSKTFKVDSARTQKQRQRIREKRGEE